MGPICICRAIARHAEIVWLDKNNNGRRDKCEAKKKHVLCLKKTFPVQCCLVKV